MAFMSMVGLSALMKEAVVKAAVSMTTPARMILTGRLAGLQPAVIRERLRETYA